MKEKWTRAEWLEDAEEFGKEHAYNLLLLGGYEMLDGSADEYDTLLQELKEDATC